MGECISVQDTLASEVYDVISQTSIFSFVGRCQPVRDNGPVGIVQLLLEKNTDIHKAGRTLWQCALSGLSSRSRGIHWWGGYYGNAIQAALADGHEAVAAPGEGHRCQCMGRILGWSIPGGVRWAAVGLLLEKDADVNAHAGCEQHQGLLYLGSCPFGASINTNV